MPVNCVVINISQFVASAYSKFVQTDEVPCLVDISVICLLAYSVRWFSVASDCNFGCSAKCITFEYVRPSCINVLKASIQHFVLTVLMLCIQLKILLMFVKSPPLTLKHFNTRMNVLLKTFTVLWINKNAPHVNVVSVKVSISDSQNSLVSDGFMKNNVIL